MEEVTSGVPCAYRRAVPFGCRVLAPEQKGNMKFTEHLAAHITPEWRKQYILYEVGQRISSVDTSEKHDDLFEFKVRSNLRDAIKHLPRMERSSFPFNVTRFSICTRCALLEYADRSVLFSTCAKRIFRSHTKKMDSSLEGIQEFFGDTRTPSEFRQKL